jgi:anti-sigma regulatory factor (Ser/Thr protein kinase)
MADVDRPAAISNPATNKTRITPSHNQGYDITQSNAVTESHDAGTLRLPAAQSSIARALAFAWLFAERAALSAEATDRLAVVVEEWLINVVEHGEAPTTSRIVVRLERLADIVRIIVSDAGRPFDPRTAAFDGPNLERGGGVGLELIRAWSRIADYRRRAGRNRVVFELAAG